MWSLRWIGCLVLATMSSVSRAADPVTECEQDRFVPLTVYVDSARVPGKDLWGTSDSLAEITIDGQTLSTTTIFYTTHPHWNEYLNFGCVNRSASMDIHIYDYDVVDSNDLLLVADWSDWSDFAPGVMNRIYNHNRETDDYFVNLQVFFEAFDSDCASGTNLYIAHLEDSFGDGWNSNALTIANCEGAPMVDPLSLATGAIDAVPLCLDLSSGYSVEVGGGTWQYEISWSITDSMNNVVVSGGAPFETSTCDNCPETCYDHSCDYWDDHYGILDGVCDYLGDELNTKYDCDCSGCSCHTEADDDACPVSYTLEMMDAFGDGWQGTSWTWATEAGVEVSSGTLVNGAYGTNELCMFHEAFECFSLTVDDDGYFTSEVSWDIVTAVNGTISASGGAPGHAHVCSDENCAGTVLYVSMEDKGGDGWNGNMLSILDCAGNALASDITLEDGPHGFTGVCLDSEMTEIAVQVGGGNYQYDVSWNVTSGDGTTIQLSGGAPSFESNCPASDDSNDPCPSNCYGVTCDYWDEEYGMSDGYCDYYGVSIESYLGCDCTGCACDQGDAPSDDTEPSCAHTYTLDMMNAWGDGWTGTEWTWSSEAGAQISTGTLETGSAGSAELCVFKNTFECYHLVVDEGSDYTSEINWDVRGEDGAIKAAGGAPDAVTICSDELCSGTVLQIWMHDSFGDGWNGNSLAILDCNEEVLFEGITLENGAEGDTQVCLDPAVDAFSVQVGGGSWQQEISWNVTTADGSVKLHGGAPGFASTCPPEDNDDTDDGGVAGPCPSTCFDFTCDYWDESYGMTGEVCDYYGTSLELEFECNCDGCKCANQTSRCGYSYTLNLYDDSGDGWDSSSWTWSSEAGAKISSGSLPAGATGTAELCMYHHSFECYKLTVDDASDHSDEIHWDIALPDGTVKASGGAPAAAVVCSDELCTGDVLTVDMHDSFGDGWNGNELEILTCEGDVVVSGITLLSGSSAMTKVCLPDDTEGFSVIVGGGSWNEEVSWNVTNADGSVFLHGGSPGFATSCPESADDGGGPACGPTCYGKSCDAWDHDYGMNEGYCDYFGSDLEQEFGCDCSSCDCDQSDGADDDGCAMHYVLEMFDTAGDGWNGNQWTWTDADGAVISTGTLADNLHSGSADLCMFHNVFECYFLIVDDSGTNPLDVSWEVRTAEAEIRASGGAPGSAFICPVELCYGEVLTISMSDAFGDGWNGNYIEFRDCQGAVIKTGITIEDGSSALAAVCMQETNYDIVVTGGSWQDEVSWVITDSSGEIVAAGGAPYAGGTCSHSPAPTPSCPSGQDVYRVDMVDAYGDGWNGNQLVIYDCAGYALLQGTVSEGFSESKYLCMDPDTGYAVTVGGGSWQTEVSWEILRAATEEVLLSGGAPTDISFCPTPAPTPCGDGEMYKALLHDADGDGWNGCVMTIENCQGQVKQDHITLLEGSDGEVDFCVRPDDLGLEIIVGGNTCDNNLSWEIHDGHGNTYASGGAPYDERFCPTPSPRPSSSPGGHHHHDDTGMSGGAVAGLVISLLLASCAAAGGFFYYKRRGEGFEEYLKLPAFGIAAGNSGGFRGLGNSRRNPTAGDFSIDGAEDEVGGYNPVQLSVIPQPAGGQNDGDEAEVLTVFDTRAPPSTGNGRGLVTRSEDGSVGV